MGPIMTLIHKSYNIIKDPDRWTQGFYQKDKNGNNCPWREGYSFCAIGALSFCNNDTDRGSYHGALCILQRHSEKMFDGNFIQTVNDSTPASLAHQNVMKVYESVIERFSDRDPNEEEWTEGVWEKSYLKKI